MVSIINGQLGCRFMLFDMDGDKMKPGRPNLESGAARLVPLCDSTRIMIIHFISVNCKGFLERLSLNQCLRGCTFPLCEMFENQIQALTTTVNLVRGVASAMWAPQGHL